MVVSGQYRAHIPCRDLDLVRLHGRGERWRLDHRLEKVRSRLGQWQQLALQRKPVLPIRPGRLPMGDAIFRRCCKEAVERGGSVSLASKRRSAVVATL